MPTSNQLLIEEMTWDQARAEALTSDPQFCEIVDKLSPDKQFTLFSVPYWYGNIIYCKGLINLPTQSGHCLPLNDPSVPTSLQTQLGYQPLPLGFLAGNGVEIYHELLDRVFSLAYFRQGLHLGIWETFAPATPFFISAGARSLQIVPKISESTSHKRLRRFGVRAPVPKTPFDQWYIFKEAAIHPDFYQPWNCRIFFLSARWMEKIKTDKAWNELYNFLIKRAWDHTNYGRNKIMLDMVWESFSRLLTSKRMKPSSYIVDTLKHLIFIITGTLPGFKPATDNYAGPVDGLIHMYLNDYGLKEYVPSLLQPYHFNPQDPINFVYYSLQVPTYLESIPKHRSSSSARIDLTELIGLIHEFLSGLENSDIMKGSMTQYMYDLLKQIEFSFFHSDADLPNEIRPSKEMPKEDSRLLYLPDNDYGERKFCDRSTFARGCIRISGKA